MPEATLVIKSAAVADYRPSNVAGQKLKRTGPMTIEFLPTEDILAEVVRQRRPGQLIVGFAAETENQLENGRAKLLRKGVDAIVVNDVSREGVGFDSDSNGATFLTATTAQDLPEMSKRKLADRILDEIVGLRRPQSLLVELSGMESELADESAVEDDIVPGVGRRGQIIIE
jgi:phosphopantothenoylcysteine decarboxylase / phosphopantothenate---cysteine ligase